MLKSMEGVKVEDLNQWVEELKRGITEHITDIFNAHADFPRAASVAFRKARPHLNDDLLAEANLAMVTAVNGVITRGQEFNGTNISGFITVAIRNALHRFIQHHTMVRIPRDTFKALKDELPIDREFVYIDLRQVFDYAGEDHPRGGSLPDLCQYLNLNETDTKIVELLDQGYSQVEVAEELHISPPAVNQRLRRIRTRFIENFQYCPGKYAKRMQVEV